jgi:hypothetical protein
MQDINQVMEGIIGLVDYNLVTKEVILALAN